ncbi:EH signature domain-containing protein [Aeromonas veronii]|nr:EH signature domain-containing protein [Aeromonas veronii]
MAQRRCSTIRISYLGDLSGGSPADNAVIMQIGDYIFVEFSHTGNACYVYRANSCGFNPDASALHLTHDLKQKNLAKGRWIHVPKPLKPDAMEGWQQKYDDELRLLGIVPNPQGANQLWNRVVKPKIVKPSVPSFQAPLGNNSESKSQVVNTPADRTVVIHSGGKGKVDFALLLEQLGENLRHYTDHREKGGAFHIEIKQRNTDDILLLRRNGFVVKTGSPFMFWKK